MDVRGRRAENYLNVVLDIKKKNVVNSLNLTVLNVDKERSRYVHSFLPPPEEGGLD